VGWRKSPTALSKADGGGCLEALLCELGFLDGLEADMIG